MRWIYFTLIVILALAGVTAASAGHCGNPGDLNLVPNCDFDTDTSSWIEDAGPIEWEGGDGASAVGSMRVTEEGGYNYFLLRSICFDATPIAGMTDVRFGGKFKESVLTAFSCELFNFRTYTSANCAGGSTLHPGSVPIDPDAEGFTQSTGTLDVPAGTQSVILEITCDGDFGMQILVDDIFLGEEFGVPETEFDIEIPTLGQLGLLVLSLSLVGTGLHRLRRR